VFRAAYVFERLRPWFDTPARRPHMPVGDQDLLANSRPPF
jgi:hypothetical protein